MPGPRFLRLRAINTPKALHNNAQGQRRSRATLGNGLTETLTPKTLYKPLDFEIWIFNVLIADALCS